MTAAERIADLSLLWKEASAVFPFFDRAAIDWDKTYREYVEKVLNVETDREFHLLLAEFMNLLGDGHTEYTPPNDLMEKTGMLPFSMQYVDNLYCVRAIKKGGEQHLGARILSINGSSMQQVVSELARYSYHVDNFLSRPRLFLPFLLKETGNVMETTAGTYLFDLEKAMPEMVEVKRAEVSALCEDIASEKLKIRIYGDGILYVKMDDFLYSGAAGEVEAVLRRYGALKGVVLDVRSNMGGMTKYAAAVAELFISGEVPFLHKQTRTMTGMDLASAGQLLLMSEEERKKWCDEEELERCRKIVGKTLYNEWDGTVGTPEHQALYSGPCVILTSRYTISAAEDFVAMFRSSGHGTIIGEPTQGTTGTPLLLRLGSGGRARICSIGNRLADGTEFMGCGILPDEFMGQSAEEYAAGVDLTLETVLKRFDN